MRQVKFTQDFDFNIHGGAGGQVSKTEGEVFQCNDDLARRLVSHWEVATYHDAMPTETKPVAPTEHKATYTLNDKGAGWFELIDEDGDVVDKIRGEQKAKDKLAELNG